jgi:hypothetical protein
VTGPKKIASYPQFVRACDKFPTAARTDVARRLGLGLLQGIAFAARLAAERGEIETPTVRGQRTHR